MIQALVILFMFVVAIEFGVHVIYHAITGKAGLYDPPFEYLRDIARGLKR